MYEKLVGVLNDLAFLGHINVLLNSSLLIRLSIVYNRKNYVGKLSSGQDLLWIIKITVTAVQHKTYMYIYTRYTVSTYIRPVYTKYTKTFWIIQELSDYMVKS